MPKPKSSGLLHPTFRSPLPASVRVGRGAGAGGPLECSFRTFSCNFNIAFESIAAINILNPPTFLYM